MQEKSHLSIRSQRPVSRSFSSVTKGSQFYPQYSTIYCVAYDLRNYQKCARKIKCANVEGNNPKELIHTCAAVSRGRILEPNRWDKNHCTTTSSIAFTNCAESNKKLPQAGKNLHAMELKKSYILFNKGGFFVNNRQTKSSSTQVSACAAFQNLRAKYNEIIAKYTHLVLLQDP